MSINKILLTFGVAMVVFANVLAQNTSSPYSRFGLGELTGPVLGSGISMGGVGIGIKDKNIVNPSNPASFAAVDTMTFLLDFGVGVSGSYYKDNGISEFEPNGYIEYVAAKIPLTRKWGVGIGLIPYTKVGYDYVDKLNDVAYDGKGGLNTLFLGTGYQFNKNFSLGLNLKYNFGTRIKKSDVVFYQNSSKEHNWVTETWILHGFNVGLGAQYEYDINSKRRMVAGAVFSNETSLNAHIKKESITTTTDTTRSHSYPSLSMPYKIGIGFSYVYDNRLTLGLDYEYQDWSSVADTLDSYSRISLGFEYLPAFYSDNYFKVIKYRAGLYYSDSYVMFGNKSLKYAGLTLGFGLPLKNQKSVLNVGFDIGKVFKPSGAPIDETYYKLSVGITFNEMWFYKRKLK